MMIAYFLGIAIFLVNSLVYIVNSTYSLRSVLTKKIAVTLVVSLFALLFT
jgi:uncharacterized membrane protein YhhN